MADFSALIQRIKDAVYENGVQAITGQILQDCLKDVVNTVNVAKQDGIYRVTVTVDNNTGVPSATARMDDDTYTLEFSFHNLKGETGPQGPQGDTPVLTADSDGVIYSDGVMLTRVIKDTTDALTTRADSDHARAESDHARAETDHTDITRARLDAETAAGEANYASLRANTAADNADAAREAIQSDLAQKQDVIPDLQQIRAGATDTVKYSTQSLTDAQKEQARTNIGAADESEVSQLRSEVEEKTFTVVTGKYIKPNGTIGTSSVGFYTNPIPVKSGEVITYSLQGNTCAILSTYLNGIYTPVVTASGAQTYTNQTYTASEDGYIVFSGTPNTLVISSSLSRIDYLEDAAASFEEAEKATGVFLDKMTASGTESNYRLDSMGAAVSASGFYIYTFPVYGSEIKVQVPSGATQTSPYSGFFDAGGNAITPMTRTDGLITKTTLQVPAGAVSFKVSIYAYAASNVAVESIRQHSLAAEIDAVQEYAESVEDKIGDLASLDTVDKSSTVAAINELKDNQYIPSTAYVGEATQVINNYDLEPELGTELLSASGWELGDGWTGNYSDGFAHTGASNGSLKYQVASLDTTAIYLLELSVTNTNTQGFSSYFAAIGGSPYFQTYRGGGNRTDKWLIIPGTGNQYLEIAATSTSWNGSITSISLKKLDNSVVPFVEYRDAAASKCFSVNASSANYKSIYLGSGNNGGFFASENVGVGVNSMKDILSGFWNVGIGNRALESVQNGSRNIAIGYVSQLENVNGHRNISIGTFALQHLVDGAQNVAIGADALQDNVSGSENVAIGIRAGAGASGSRNIAIGSNSLAAIAAGTDNVAIGRNSGQKLSGKVQNVAIGGDAMGNTTGGTGNTCVGFNASPKVTGNYNVAIGYGAAGNLEYGMNNIVIGKGVSLPSPNTSNTIVIGANTHTSVIIAGKILTFNEGGTISWTEQ